MDLQPFKRMISENCGLCFEAEKEALLADRIRARMTGRGLTAESEYLACLRGDSGEVRALIDLLTVNETYFFRESAHLGILADKIVPALLASGGQVRILCAGCSSGEEPYSVMMALLEKYGTGIGKNVSVIGVDIDRSVLQRAERGRYSGLSFRGFPKHLREKYFDGDGEDSVIRDFVKNHVRFLNVNLKGDVYPEALHDFDVIFYRNVSIYFEPETRRYIFERLAGLLREEGWIFVGAAETLAHSHGVLSLVEIDGVFCYQKSVGLSLGSRRKETAFRPAQPHTGPQVAASLSASGASVPGGVQSQAAVRHSAASPPDIARTNRPLFDEALSLAKSKEYENALRRIDRLLAEEPSLVKALVLKAGILINLKCFEEAGQVCRETLAKDRWSLEGHLLLGLIAKVRGDNAAAAGKFKEALYIQSACWLAHLHLADIYCEQGERKNAAREYEIVIRLLEKEDLPEQGLTFFPLAFPAEQIVHLCRHNLEKLKGD